MYQQVLDGYQQRVNDGYIPVVQQVILPNLCLAPNFPQNFTQIGQGLFYFQYCVPSGAWAVGTHLLDVAYLSPVDGYIVNEVNQVVVSAPFGNFGVSPYHYPPSQPLYQSPGHRWDHNQQQEEYEWWNNQQWCGYAPPCPITPPGCPIHCNFPCPPSCHYFRGAPPNPSYFIPKESNFPNCPTKPFCHTHHPYPCPPECPFFCQTPPYPWRR
jgi:hypothetical protein